MIVMRNDFIKSSEEKQSIMLLMNDMSSDEIAK